LAKDTGDAVDPVPADLGGIIGGDLARLLSAPVDPPPGAAKAGEHNEESLGSAPPGAGWLPPELDPSFGMMA